MKRHSSLLILVAAVIIFFISSSTAMFSSSVIDRLRPTEQEIPAGFMYGQVPGFAKGLLKNNPWNLDQDAIKRMTNRIYPGGEYSKVSNLHMTIIANRKNPYGDDIVCYIFIFKNEKSAQEEIAKLTEYVGYNSDRSILIEKDNLAVYLCVDSTKDFDHIKSMSEIIKTRLEKL